MNAKLVAVEIDDFDNGKYLARSEGDCRDYIDMMIFRRVMETGGVISQGSTSGRPIYEPQHPTGNGLKKCLVAVTGFMIAVVAMGGTADRAAELIKDFEGFRPSVYKCEAGRETIGYGFTDKALVARGQMSEGESSAELLRLCEGITLKLRKELGEENKLTTSEETAIVSFIYNVGWHNFKASKVCRLLKEGKRGATIGVELRKWVYVTKGGRKVKSRGLSSRRQKEAICFMIG